MLFEKVIKKIKCKKDGFKVVNVDGKQKCVKMSAQEIKNRKKAAKVSAKKRKSKMAQIIKQMQKTKKANAKKHDKKVVKEI